MPLGVSGRKKIISAKEEIGLFCKQEEENKTLFLSVLWEDKCTS